jgi:uncharacterized protein (DUF427 family)
MFNVERRAVVYCAAPCYILPAIHQQAEACTPPMKAIWNNTVVAESNDTVVVENNHYFPANSIKKEYFEDSIAHTSCPWKGRASYYSLRVNGELNKDAAWYYPQASPAAANIEGRIAFWKGVKIEN